MCWEKNDNSRPLWNGFGVKCNVLLLIGVVVLEHHALLKIFQSHTHHSYDFKWISLLSCLSTFSNLMKSHPPFLMFKQISIHLNYIFNFRTRLCNSERNPIGLLVFYGLFIFYFFLYFISYRLVRKVTRKSITFTLISCESMARPASPLTLYISISSYCTLRNHIEFNPLSTALECI